MDSVLLGTMKIETELNECQRITGVADIGSSLDAHNFDDYYDSESVVNSVK
jgi:hypothetical protein